MTSLSGREYDTYHSRGENGKVEASVTVEWDDEGKIACIRILRKE